MFIRVGLGEKPSRTYYGIYGAFVVFVFCFGRIGSRIQYLTLLWGNRFGVGLCCRVGWLLSLGFSFLLLVLFMGGLGGILVVSVNSCLFSSRALS